MTVKYFFLFGFIFLFQSFYGQNSKNSSLSYEQLTDSFHKYEGKIDIQKVYAREYLNKAKKEKNIEKIATGYHFYSYFFENETYFKYCDSAIQISMNFKNDKFPMIAFTRKAKKLIKDNKYNEAIDNLLLAEKYALKFNNLDYYYDSKNIIGVIKSEYLGEYDEAIKLYKESLKYFIEKKNKGPQYGEYYLRILLGIADSYKSLKKTDSANYYNIKGHNESIEMRSFKMKYLFILNEGANKIANKKFKDALDSINKALPELIKNKDVGNVLASYFYLGETYKELGNNPKAVYYFEKVDSIYNIKGNINPDFIGGYSYLINYYKKINNKENQIQYINKFIKIDSTLHKNYKQIMNKIQKDYDIPNLMKDKEIMINEFKSNKKSNHYIIISLFIIILMVLFFSLYQTRLKKTYKRRFETLVSETISEPSLQMENISEKKPQNINNLGISDSVIENILMELKIFEKNKDFLNPSINIQNLAIEFNSNSKYLSAIINSKKQKSFVNYVNDLRIDYIVGKLKMNKNLRKYSITAIAEEAGFNTAESFSKAFIKKTGIKPSYFIKELGGL